MNHLPADRKVDRLKDVALNNGISGSQSTAWVGQVK
jgi:hypothetical protein